MKSWLWALAMFVLLAILAPLLSSPQLRQRDAIVVPAPLRVEIGEESYEIELVPGLEAPASDNGFNLQLRYVASELICPNGGSGLMKISSDLNRLEQAKAMIHETVHIAENCDDRDLAVDERIAQDIADLLQSPEGAFIVEELR